MLSGTEGSGRRELTERNALRCLAVGLKNTVDEPCVCAVTKFSLNGRSIDVRGNNACGNSRRSYNHLVLNGPFKRDCSGVLVYVCKVKVEKLTGCQGSVDRERSKFDNTECNCLTGDNLAVVLVQDLDRIQTGLEAGYLQE